MKNRITLVLVLTIVLGTLLLPSSSQAQGDEPAVLYVTVPNQATIQALVDAGLDVWHVDQVDAQYIVTVWADPTDPRLAGYQITIDGERTQIYRDAPSQVGVTGVDGLGFMGGYLTAAEVYAHLDALAVANPTLAQSYDCGDSWDKVTAGGPAGYDIKCLHVGGTNNIDVVIVAGEHARELMGPEIARLWAEWLLGSEADAAYLRFFDHRIMPMVNPDGHRMVETTGSLWRKNTHTGCGNANLRGVDIGRNYASVTYGGPGSSTDPCNEVYRGTGAASEPETQATQGVMAAQFSPLARNTLVDPAPVTTADVFATIHTFGGEVYMPWSTNQQTPNHGQIRNICDLLGGKSGYSCKFPFDYPASGTVEDHAYDDYGVATVGFEVGNDFFEPYNNLPTRWNQMRPALVYVAKLAPAPYQLRLGPQPVTIGLWPAMVNTDTTVTVNANVSDSNNGGQAIAAAQLFIGTPPEFGGTAIAMSAADGAFDEVSEQVTGNFSTAGLAAGRHLVMVRARDASGNWGVVSAVWLVRVDGPIYPIYLPINLKDN
jgi:hypothetical protein